MLSNKVINKNIFQNISKMIQHKIISCVLILYISVSEGVRPQCGLYGAPPCQYVPAPPGQTPSCARPGSTYCEKMHYYPMKVVNQLITQYGYDINKLLIDETGDELRTSSDVFGPIHGLQSHSHGSYPINQPNHNQYVHNQGHTSGNAGYSYPNPNAIPVGGGYNYPVPHSVYQTTNEDPIYIPKPRSQSNFPQHPNRAQTVNYVIERQQITEYNPSDAFRRYTRGISLNKELRKYSDIEEVTANPVLEENESMPSTNRTRTKRQSIGRIQLCDVNTQFIMPQAALNSQGNWMYVINQDNMSRQLVKTETCASSVCTNLCQLPNGYNSRCEQKFIQKRLIALDANGQNFYTDTFWFPSCCVCTLSNE